MNWWFALQPGRAVNTEPGQADLRLHEFQPRSLLRTPQRRIERPCFPVIDAHNHLAGHHWEDHQRPVSDLLEQLDSADVSLLIDLDGGWGESILHRHLDTFKATAPDRFVLFGGVDWSQWPEQGDRFGEWAARRLRAQAARGAQGLKIWKNLGLHVTDQRGVLVAVDDPRLDPLWATAAELELPVMIHVADPPAFFQPIDRFNEQWTILRNYPEWHFPSPPFPAFATVMEQFTNLLARHRQTQFIGAHVACYAEDLGWVSSLLDRCPNLCLDISARVAELGRKPYSSREFFLHYQDRILFGTDMGPDPEQYRVYYRFLETWDEYFDYGNAEENGRWRIYGIGLPDDVLRKVYGDNVRRVLRLERGVDTSAREVVLDQ